MRRFLLTTILAVGALSPATALGQSTFVTIINPGFEIGTSGTAVSIGWSQIPGLGPMLIDTAGGIGDTNPHSGNNYLTANRQVPEPDYPTNQDMGVFQNVDLSPYARSVSPVGSVKPPSLSAHPRKQTIDSTAASIRNLIIARSLPTLITLA
jgi:hypothetical protein